MKKKISLLLMVLSAIVANGQHDMHFGKQDTVEIKTTFPEVHTSLPMSRLLAAKQVESTGKNVVYDIFVRREKVNITGKPVWAITLNGKIPGPTLEFTVGDTAVINIHNEMEKETSLHWHGILLPNEQDGVAYLNSPPVLAGKTVTFKFKLVQTGTYWFHSHTAYQEQVGVYGSIVIHPKKELHKVDKELVMVLSDWTNEKPSYIMKNLKRRNEWYSIKKNNIQSLDRIIKHKALGAYLKQSFHHMPPMDLSDVLYQRFLINGKDTSFYNDFKPGDKVRLRVINAGSSTYFHVNYAGGKMRVIAADGIDVKHYDTERVLIASAETYDFIIEIPPSGAYEFRASAQDGSGYASAFLGSGKKYHAPKIPKPDLYAMTSAMSKMSGKGMGNMSMSPESNNDANQNMDGMNMGGMEKSSPDSKNQNSEDKRSSGEDKNDQKGMNMKKEDPSMMKDMDMNGMQMTSDTSKNSKPGSENQMPSPENKKQEGNMNMDGMNMDGMDKASPDSKNQNSKDKRSSGGDKSKHKGMDVKKEDHSMMKDMNMNGMEMTSDTSKNSKPRTENQMPSQGNKKQEGNMNMDGMDMDGMNMDKEKKTESKSPADKMDMNGMKMDAGNSNKQATDLKPEKSSGTNIPEKKSASGGMNMEGMKDGSQKMSMPTMDPLFSTDYSKLEALEPTTFPENRKVTIIPLELTGNMYRFIWGFNGKTFSQEDKIPIKRGEIVQFKLINKTMMLHPMHLHGHFFRVLNGKGEYSPLKHTVNIAPMETVVIEFLADEEKDWFFHCHLLYHMLSGMARIVSYDYPPMRTMDKKLEKMHKKDMKDNRVFFWGRAELGITSNYLLANFSNNKNAVIVAGNSDWRGNFEADADYERYLGQFFRVFAGVDGGNEPYLRRIGDRVVYDRKIIRAVAGIRYVLPFLIDSEVKVDALGNVRFQLTGQQLLTRKMFLEYELQWLVRGYTRAHVGLGYTLNKNLSLFTSYDSRYKKLNAGLGYNF